MRSKGTDARFGAKHSQEASAAIYYSGAERRGSESTADGEMAENQKITIQNLFLRNVKFLIPEIQSVYINLDELAAGIHRYCDRLLSKY